MSTLYNKWLFISLLLFCTYLLENLATCSVCNHLTLVITKYGKSIFLMEMAKHPSSFTNLGHCRLQKKKPVFGRIWIPQFCTPSDTQGAPLLWDSRQSFRYWNISLGGDRQVLHIICCILWYVMVVNVLFVLNMYLQNRFFFQMILHIVL